ncbi:MAG: dephospho-CoA kinase [Bacteroidetes bacterium]|nr:dephospho-CoA kinase [Bacteroidota bacterium]
MKRPLRIGVTGGIGSGKSLVCKIFSSLGIPVYDADSRAKKLMNEDALLCDQIKKKFGAESYVNGLLNREYLSRYVFNDSQKLQELNELVHPRVLEDSERWIIKNKEATYIIKEAALLFESGSYKTLDKIIVVSAPEELRVKRVLLRDRGRTKEDVAKIISNQMNEQEKTSRADFIIRNDESTLVVPQVLNLHERFNKGLEK